MIIRDYRDADLAACMDVWRDASDEAHAFLGAKALASDETIVRDGYMPEAEIRVAEEDGVILGFIAFLNESFVGGLFVAPAAQRRGIGRALIRDAAARRGALEVDVYARNVRAIAFYVREGFEATGTSDTDDQGRPHPLVHMRRPG